MQRSVVIKLMVELFTAKMQRGKEKRLPPASLLICTFAVKIVISPSS